MGYNRRIRFLRARPTLGGGLGWFVRKHGLALDNLLSADIVLADGRLVTANASEHGDLFWPIRGGGGNFGVVTNFQFQTHPVGTVLAGIALHPAASAASALQRWRDFEASHLKHARKERCSSTFHDPTVHPPWDSRWSVRWRLRWSNPGSRDCASSAARIRAAAGRPLSTDAVQFGTADGGLRVASRAPRLLKSSLNGLSDEAIKVIVEFFARVPSKRTGSW